MEDDVQEILDGQNDNGDPPNEMEVCSWCADPFVQGDHLLMCDECPRGFCDDCVCKAHGRGKEGQSVVKHLLEDDGKWACIYCSPTVVLDAMRAFLQSADTNASASSNFSKEGADESSKADQNEEENLADLLEELSTLEDELEETEIMLESEGIEKKRLEIQKETPGQLSANVEIELNHWVKETKDKHHRCSDAIGIIHDDLGKYNPFAIVLRKNIISSLETTRFRTDYAGIDIAAFYKKREENKNKDIEQTSDEWKSAADEALDKRDRELGFAKGGDKGASGWSGKEENYREIDELNSSELDEIEDINTTDEALAQLEQIVLRKLNGPTGGHAGTLIDSNTIKNFKKNISRDDKALKELKVKLNKKSELGDKRRETQQLKEDCHIIGKHNTAAIRVVRRNANLLVQKRKTSKPKKAATDFLKRRNYSSRRVPDHQVDQEYGIEDAVFENSNCVLASLAPSEPSTNNHKEEIAVAAPLAKLLKAHQISGVKFMWDTAFCDLLSIAQAPAKQGISNAKGVPADNKYVRGCILGTPKRVNFLLQRQHLLTFYFHILS